MQIDNKENFLLILQKSIDKYFECGPRSCEKVNIIHHYIEKCINEYITKYHIKDITVKNEYNVAYKNFSGKKKCDIVILYKNEPKIIIPVKCIMSNYKKNKNNYFENLIGELTILSLSNPNIIIIPLNILFANTPILDKNSKIKNIENNTYENSLKCYNEITIQNVYYQNYIIQNNISSQIGDIYNNMIVNDFSDDTQYISFENIIKQYIN